jgi:multiple sugar transport system permease protein
MNKAHNVSLPYIFLAPALLMIVSFLVYPIGNVFYYSLQHFDRNKPYLNKFAGLDNFKTIFTDDPLFYQSLGVTLKWVAVLVIVQLIIGLIISLVLNQSFKYRAIFRSITFAPWAISGVITSVIWGMMLNEHMGIFNDIFLRLGIIEKKIAWTANVNTVFPAVVIGELWRGIPFFAITLLASLQTIPGELYEAARCDGAGRWRSFVHVTLPYLKNTIILTTLLRTAWEANNIDLIFNLTGGGPVHATTTLTMYIAQQSIKFGNFGYGSALAVVSFLILLVFSVIYLTLSRFGKEEAH